MRREPGRDSLDQVELVMLLEEEVGIDVGELGADRADLLLEIACLPYEARWAAPEPRAAWPPTVRVVGEECRRVLFTTGRGSWIGVGCRGTDGVIDTVRVYPSLQRALFAFERHECLLCDAGA